MNLCRRGRFGRHEQDCARRGDSPHRASWRRLAYSLPGVAGIPTRLVAQGPLRRSDGSREGTLRGVRPGHRICRHDGSKSAGQSEPTNNEAQETKKGPKHMSNNNGQKVARQAAVATGGSRGIGAAIAKRLAADGASVAITYAKDANSASAVGKAIERDGGQAVAMFTQALAREIGSRGIPVNNVQPGPIDTDLNPASGDWAVPQKAAPALDRYGNVDEIAAMVAFVAGPESSYITGSNLTVD